MKTYFQYWAASHLMRSSVKIKFIWKCLSVTFVIPLLFPPIVELVVVVGIVEVVVNVLTSDVGLIGGCVVVDVALVKGGKVGGRVGATDSEKKVIQKHV